MKLLATVALASSVALATPTWCTNPGQGCWKREAAPVPEPVPEADPTWCTNPGQGCWKAKREAEAEAEPTWCTNPGQGCWKVKREAEAEAVPTWCTNPGQGCWKREADPTWCTNPGQGCWKAKREAEAEAEAKKKKPEIPNGFWCTNPGQGCWKAKRDASPAPEPWSLSARDAEAIPEALSTSWCMLPGQDCLKIKRAVDAFVDGVAAHNLTGVADASHGWPAIQLGSSPAFNEFATYIARLGGAKPDPEDPARTCFALGGCVHANVSHEDAAALSKRDADPTWCTNPGQGCWKREAYPDPTWCTNPGQGCWKVKRDDVTPEVVSKITRDVLEAIGGETETLEQRTWCTNPGQGCWKAKRDLATIREFARGLLTE